MEPELDGGASPRPFRSYSDAASDGVHQQLRCGVGSYGVAVIIKPKS